MIICHLPPIRGTRNNHWFLGGFVLKAQRNPARSKWLWRWCWCLAFSSNFLGVDLLERDPWFHVEKCLNPYSGSTIVTLLHGKINPKNWQVASLLVMSRGFPIFLGLFQVIVANPVIAPCLPREIVYSDIQKIPKVVQQLGMCQGLNSYCFPMC